jgi:hypothetical protein
LVFLFEYGQYKFFQEQKLVPFKKVWYFHDHIKSDKKPDLEYLSSFEKKYNIDLWKLAINERIFYRFFDFHKFTSDEILSIEEHVCKLFESVLDEVKPDFIVTKEPSFHHLEIFYELCRARGIKVLMLSIPKVGFRCMVSEEPQKISTNKTLQDVQGKNRSIKELREYVNEFNPAKSVLIVIKNQGKSLGTSKRKSLTAAIKYFLLDKNKNIKTNYNYYGRTKCKVFFYTLKTVLEEKYRHRFINANLVSKVDYESKFVYFPLGVDLERNILIAAPFCTNQIEIIRHVAKSLPVGYKLYVKETPAAVTRSWRSISEYKEIMNIPNVTLIHPAVNSEKLVQGCCLVSTIGGSTGFQAAFYNKPSVIFSETVYSIIPSVYTVKILEELPKIIKTALHTKINISDLDKYITLLDENSFEINLFKFLNDCNSIFYYNGFLIDSEVKEYKLKIFLQDQKDILNKLANEHFKKITLWKMTKAN